MTEKMAGNPVPGLNLRNEPLQIDFLYWEECPSHARALRLLEEVVRHEGVQAHITRRQVESDEEAERLQFPGSPTIRINGFDIDADPALPIGLSCRVYRQPDGRVGPLPSEDLIAGAIERAVRDPQLADSAAGA